MSDPFVITIDRLTEGATQKIEGTVSPDFLEVNEPDLRFTDPIKISGEAYLADDELVIHLNASTLAQMPCSICNQMVHFPLDVKSFYHAEPLSNIQGVFFDFRTLLREALLIELPKVAECSGGCPEREILTPYLRKKDVLDTSTSYFPFNDLKLP